MMKLSEAIREGAKLRPQGFGGFFMLGDDNELCSCALGAAWEAKTKNVTPPDNYNVTVLDLFELSAAKVRSPQKDKDRCGGRDDIRQYPLGYVIAIMNDEHHYTREQIADYLEVNGY